MANEVFSFYTFKGDIPEEFHQLESLEYPGPKEVGKIFDLEFDDNRWYVSEDYGGVQFGDNTVTVSVWSAWVPFTDPWEQIKDKYDLELTWYSVNECDWWFDSNSDDNIKFKVFYDYEDDDWQFGQFDEFYSLEAAKEFIKKFEIDPYKIIGRIDYEDWYDEDELEWWLDKKVEDLIKEDD